MNNPKGVAIKGSSSTKSPHAENRKIHVTIAFNIGASHCVK